MSSLVLVGLVCLILLTVVALVAIVAVALLARTAMRRARREDLPKMLELVCRAITALPQAVQRSLPGLRQLNGTMVPTEPTATGEATGQ